MSRDWSSAPAAATLGMYAGAHLAVDATCGVVLWNAVHDGVIASSTAWSAFIVYNLLAFALQPLVGLAVDRLGAPRGAAAAGAALTALAVPLAAVDGSFTAAVIAAGLGNAVFHVGGGVAAVAVAPGRATPLGLFVAPGAAGVAAGIAVGRAGGPAWPFVVAMLVLALVPLALPRPLSWRAATTPPRPAAKATGALELAVLLVLFVVAVRSYVGFAVVFPWKAQTGLLVALTAAVVAGKAVGGIAADRLGWRPVAVGALLVSAPLLALGTTSAAAGVTGALVFNFTMPVTMAAAIAAVPGRPGFAFGLTCLALFVGFVPSAFGWSGPASTAVVLTLAAAAALALWIGFDRLGITRPAGGRPTPATASQPGVS